MADVLALTYIGGGAYRPTLPARDLDADDIAATAAQQKRTVEAFVAEALACGLYRPTFAESEGIARLEGRLWADLAKADLLAIAGEQGINLPKRATNAEIIAAIKAAAANQGGDATPGDDPAADATGEPGTPPTGDEG
jgi:hypothetical protein